MGRELRKIAFLFEEFAPATPGQQLLDRFLIGYPRDGEFHDPRIPVVAAHLMLGVNAPELDDRADDYDLTPAETVEAAVAGADAVVVVPRRPGGLANERFVELALQQAPAGGACFVYGALCNRLARGQEFARVARERNLELRSGASLSLTWRLPPVELPWETPLADALVVAQGPFPGAEMQALDALAPVIERRRGGESGVRRVYYLEGEAVWRAGDRGLWSWPLLAAALSRSDSPQGDSVLDGRTQDLVGLGQVPKLARQPRALALEHEDGLRTTVLTLDGVVADFNFAVRAVDGAVVSAQLFRAPPPGEQHFSLLAAALEDWFRGGPPGWPLERGLLIAGLLETFAQPAARDPRGVATPDLRIKYRAERG